MIRLWLKGLVMSLGMFSILPVPHLWDDKAMSLMIPALSIVGLIIGGLWYLISSLLGGGNVIFILLISITPSLLSGFIHVDGLMDTADAVFSRRSLEERRRILKDSHVGAFAVIVLLCYVLFLFAAVYEISNFLPLLFIPALARCVSGLALLVLRPMSETGYGGTFRANTNVRHCVFLAAVAALCLGTAAYLKCPLLPLFAIIAVGTALAFYLYRQFKGMSGDLCGAIICGSELAALLTLALI